MKVSRKKKTLQIVHPANLFPSTRPALPCVKNPHKNFLPRKIQYRRKKPQNVTAANISCFTVVVLLSGETLTHSSQWTPTLGCTNQVPTPSPPPSLITGHREAVNRNLLSEYFINLHRKDITNQVTMTVSISPIYIFFYIYILFSISKPTYRQCLSG